MNRERSSRNRPEDIKTLVIHFDFKRLFLSLKDLVRENLSQRARKVGNVELKTAVAEVRNSVAGLNID
jgi:hypothetical protein